MQQPYNWNGGYSSQTPPPLAPDLSGYIQRLYQSEQKLQEMSAQLASMQKQLEQLSNKPPLHIEYHFDQLKVNRLEGTLNVGISPQGIQSLESFETPDPSCWNFTSEPADAADTDGAIRGIQKEMSEYMTTSSANVLKELERQNKITLDTKHRQSVIDDVKKQLDERVHYYARMSAYPSTGTEDERRQWKDEIKEKTRKDVQGAFSAYLGRQQQFPKEGPAAT